MPTTGPDDVAARLAAGREARMRRRRWSVRLMLLALALVFVAVTIDDDSGLDWLDGVLKVALVSLFVLSHVIRRRHDSAAMDQLARTSMWGLAVGCLAASGLAIAYAAADRQIPPDALMNGVALLVLIVMPIGTRGAGAE